MNEWTDEDRALFAKMGRRSAASRKARIQAKVDARFPHLAQADREAIADMEYRTQLQAQGRLAARRFRIA